MAIRIIVFLSLLLSLYSADTFRKEYQKHYYDNGKLKSEGWTYDKKPSGYWKFYFKTGKIAYQGHFQNGFKEDYWYYYYPDGTIQKEGHFQNGAAVKWWIYYDMHGHIIHKCQLKNGIKNGYCLKYKDQKLSSAERYQNGRKIDEWFDFSSFKKANNLSDLK